MTNILKINPSDLGQHIDIAKLEQVVVSYHDLMSTDENCGLCESLAGSDMFGNMYRQFLVSLSTNDPQEVEGHYFAALTMCLMVGFMLGIHTVMEKGGKA